MCLAIQGPCEKSIADVGGRVGGGKTKALKDALSGVAKDAGVVVNVDGMLEGKYLRQKGS